MIRTRVLDLRMSSRHRSAHDRRVVLLDLVHRPGFVPGEMEEQVLEEACMSGREDEAFAPRSCQQRSIEGGRGRRLRSRLNHSGLAGLYRISYRQRAIPIAAAPMTVPG